MFIGYRLRKTAKEGHKFIKNSFDSLFDMTELSREGGEIKLDPVVNSKLKSIVRGFSGNLKEELTGIGNVMDTTKIQSLLTNVSNITGNPNFKDIMSSMKDTSTNAKDIINSVKECLESDCLTKHTELVKNIKDIVLSNNNVKSMYFSSPDMIELEKIKSNNFKESTKDIDNIIRGISSKNPDDIKQKLGEYSEFVGEKLGLGAKKQLPWFVGGSPHKSNKDQHAEPINQGIFTADDTRKINELISTINQRPWFFNDKSAIIDKAIEIIGILKRRSFDISYGTGTIVLKKGDKNTSVNVDQELINELKEKIDKSSFGKSRKRHKRHVRKSVRKNVSGRGQRIR
jgi:hypothetical protein